MKISLNDALSLLQGLAQLDGYDKIVKDTAGVERTVRSGFTFSAKTKLIIALNRKRLGEIVQTFNEQRAVLFKELSAGNEQLQAPDKIAAFRKQEQEMLSYKEEISLVSFSIKELRLDDANNQNISPSILVAISPVLSDFEEGALGGALVAEAPTLQ